MTKLTYIDLFAGAGGLSEGFIRNGFEPIAHVEMDKAACYTLKTRQAYHYLKGTPDYKFYKKYMEGTIGREVLYSLIPKTLREDIINLPIGAQYNQRIFTAIDKKVSKDGVDLIIGGPPCQAYSLVGRARDKNGMAGDQRNYLYLQYAKYLERYQPKMFVFENVPGLLSAKGGEYFKNMQKRFRVLGYDVKPFKVDATDFGVLQNRKRIIILGWKKELKPQIPDLENHKASLPYKVESIFSDLPALYAGCGENKSTGYVGTPSEYLKKTGIRNGVATVTQHIARPHSAQDKEIYRIAVEKWNSKKERLKYNDLPSRLKTHKNTGSFTDRFKVVAADENYSQTIVAHIAKDGHYYIHPDIEQNRSISVREAARLQSFPDDYYFEGVKEEANRTAAFKQIGNAVPPLMAEQIAKSIKKTLWKKEK